MSEDVKKVEESKELKVDTYPSKAYNDVVIEVEGKEGRVYRYIMPLNAPLAESHMAGVNVLLKIKEIHDDIVEKQKKKAAAESGGPKEEEGKKEREDN